MSDKEVYVSDDPTPFSHEDMNFNALHLTTAGGDYFLTTMPYGYVPLSGYVETFTVRIRTSGSNDPRNDKVCLAMYNLWKALNGE